jgi:hypothetical protein
VVRENGDPVLALCPEASLQARAPKREDHARMGRNPGLTPGATRMPPLTGLWGQSRKAILSRLPSPISGQLLTNRAGGTVTARGRWPPVPPIACSSTPGACRIRPRSHG